MNFQPIILSGGSGTRLWPLSREKYPKQLLTLFNQYSMLQNTALRFDSKVRLSLKVNDPVVVSNKEYRFLIAEQLRQININSKIVLEPCGRNTAPALTLAALKTLEENQDAIMLVMPADHLIENVNSFHKAIELGILKAKEGGVVCFGIPPTRADIGYGYIKTESVNDSGIKVLDSFVEKPNLETALGYLKSGDYVWNSGIFMLKASTWVNAISQLNPKIYEACKKAYELATIDKDFIWVDNDLFSASPEDSIDYCVMEHIGKDNKYNLDAYVVPMSVGWSDVGSWDAVWEQSNKDNKGNVTNRKEDTFFYNSQDSLVFSDNKRLISLLDLNDIVVVDTQDALLVANKSKLSNIKQLVGLIRETHMPLTQLGRKVYRPWGNYDSIDSGDNFQVKRIIVNSGETLSLQMHYHRAEHWVVVKGTGKITRDNETFLLHENQSVYIPIGTVHRLENPGKLPLELIEVQSGNYLGEDDIVRLEDVYGRVKE
ncbi:mannose-1-phosphate guanylyltransferase/mannose-6-phosphate isomerase [Acinetobacter gerneri]|uniref:mannose-1-phosphate guanylyltransferase n=1 Tax=Acinetobacter gerneri DSM 14967 = CIP 107464 = MTCC 9824 TaxID=1120926 RepID=N8ZM05_9GAMM|nr:mannose-1-phosphate guanylyltransferase/mannose-6-phosphate isomerase [Acinetobacter gerneri]ENV34774.1 mannose-1-phosphate guanylyltransferase/mannose-6-phosphate isomerase [Acinetobacter gerneri DSM 14967 = CIP 107464 = MTCC 9824]EPR80528.1 Mannose-1-phosphate guanylyltransferase (GDP) [Acinetobacter gerneri DSM 14967 = CIP 107464 = MTCC 9824]